MRLRQRRFVGDVPVARSPGAQGGRGDASRHPANRSSIPFNAHVTAGSHTATVRVAGELDVATGDDLVRALDVAGADGRTVLLDLDETTFLDSAGIRIMVAAAQRLSDEGSTLRLVAVSPAAERILRLTGLFDAFKEPER